MREIRWIDGLWPKVRRIIRESVEDGWGHSALPPKQFPTWLTSCGRVPRRLGLDGCHSEGFEAGLDQMCDPSCLSRGKSTSRTPSVFLVMNPAAPLGGLATRSLKR
jgi:hypothetical protein